MSTKVIKCPENIREMTSKRDGTGCYIELNQYYTATKDTLNQILLRISFYFTKKNTKTIIYKADSI